MPEPKSVSPLLDGFMIGTPVNEHFGVCCYPAVKESSDRKFIVKMISIPASQTQLDALLITGAYRDSGHAADYFSSLAEDVAREAEFLKEMSRLEGFLPFEGCQIEPMRKNRIGYEVCLLSGFRLSLERYMHRSTVTHLEAVNLGIDLCTALAACRRAGKIYIDLKPSNIYISTRKEYKIGDLGFAALDSMAFTPMPEKYRSPYTAPELMDDLSVLNGTADTYAVGMILYQLFNNGVLPEDPAAGLPAPVNADETMAAIVLKACAVRPEDRWEDPIQMGQAIRDYLQTETVNDTPIMPPITGNALGGGYQTAKFPVPSEKAEEENAEKAEAAEASESGEAPEAEEDAPVQQEETAEAEPQADEAPDEAAESDTEADSKADNAPSEAEKWAQAAAAEIEAAAAAEFAALTGEKIEDENSEPTIDEAHLDSELEALHQILKTEKPAPKAPDHRKEKNVEPVVIREKKKKKSPVRALFIIFLLCLLGAAGTWGYMFYTTAYMVNVDSLTVEGTVNRLTVKAATDAQPGSITVTCSDPYGNSSTKTLRDGTAEFTDLTPGTFYTVELEIAGLHKLNGPVTGHFTTESATTVAAFTASVGNEDGSAMLNLIVEGHMPDQWKVRYSAEGEPELRQTFAGNSTVISSLVIGKTYTFYLENGSGDPVNGNCTTQLKASRVVAARDVNIISCTDGKLLVNWDSNLPQDAEGWIVRCYGDGYDETQEVQKMQASFSGILDDRSYTVDVRAKGMGQSDRDTISANPITLTDFQVDASSPQELSLSWDFLGTAPEGGWLVQYTLDDTDLPLVMKSQTSQAVIAPRIPGAVYHFNIQAGDTSVLNRRQTYQCPAAEIYIGHGINSNNLNCFLLRTPEGSWSYASVGTSLNTSIFHPGDPISVILGSNIAFYIDAEQIQILYVFRDASGNVLTELIAEDTVDWHDLWARNDYKHTEIDLPVSPTKPGSYTLEIYFNGKSAAAAGFIVD